MVENFCHFTVGHLHNPDISKMAFRPGAPKKLSVENSVFSNDVNHYEHFKPYEDE
jgi:hypothetical protein